MNAVEYVVLGLIGASCLYVLVVIYPAAWRQMRREKREREKKSNEGSSD